MPHFRRRLRTFRRTAGVVGAGALIALGTASGAAADDSGTGLVLGEIAPIDGVKPGSTFEAPVTFADKGAAALPKVWLSYSVTRGLSHTEMPSNCERWDVGSYDEMPARSSVICEFDQAVEPGAVYAPERPLVLKALDRALYDDLFVMVANHEISADENASGPVRGTGPAVKLVEQPAGSAATGGGSKSPDWDSASVRVSAVNTADFQVTGARLTGRAGATVDAQVKFTNAGPAWVMGELGTSVTRVLIKVPAGTRVVGGLQYCKNPAAGTYDCGTAQSWVEEGQVQNYKFRLKIDKAVAGAAGSVALEEEARPYDVNKANDKADILLDTAGGGSTGGSGTTGGSGSTGGSGTAGGSGSGSTGGSGTAGGSAATGGGADTSGGSPAGGSAASGGASATGGNLAATGSGPALPLAGTAAAVVAAGAGTVLLVRRRAARR
ncbi:hypothetical protein ABZT08_09445 [Streptomyces sp. NPDC005526]|uniref:hypothetical protein n=1 Tax=Streptomyces sp. NPDC005526 TaxID=3156885 RepID=UPI0033B1E862